MALPTQIPTVAFHSALLPPIRISLSALRTLHRPQCDALAPCTAPPQHLTQRRALNLYKSAKAKTVLGQHKALPFSWYKPSSPAKSPHRINLYDSDKHGRNLQLKAKNLSLKEVYDEHLKPGYMLYNTQALKKNMAKLYKNTGEEIPAEYNDYTFVKPHTHSVPLDSSQKGRQMGGLKNIIVSEGGPPSYYRISLDRAYQFIENGSAVEMRIRLQAKLSKEQRGEAGDPTVWPWYHDYFPHYRPDFILKSMPEGTVFVINPVSDGHVCQWVMALGTKVGDKDLNKRFVKIQDSVRQSIKRGNQSMLPKRMRQELLDTGSEHYSTNTGLPKDQARGKFARGGKVTYGAEERKHQKRTVSQAVELDPFMAPDPGAEAARVKHSKTIRDEAARKAREQGLEVRMPKGSTHRWSGRGYQGRDE